MAENQGLEYTSKNCSRSSSSPHQPCWAMYSSVFCALRSHCGSSAPGRAARASRNNSTNAVRMDVSPRHVLRRNAQARRSGVCR